MKCKFCFAEIEEDMAVCPVCGKELSEQGDAVQMPEEQTVSEEIAEVAAEETAEEAPADSKKKHKGWKIGLAVAGLAVMAVVLTGAVLYFMGLSDDVLRTVGIGKNDVYFKESYTADNEAVGDKATYVVATLGDQQLTNGELQAYYWMSVFDFLDYYGAYLSYIGVDMTVPLDQQVYDEETGMTYQQWFLENAIETWHRYATLVQMAQEAGFTLSQEQQDQLSALPDSIKEMAEEEGFTDIDAFIDAEFFPGSDMESYMKYNTVCYTALCYYDTLYESMMPTQDEIEAYYQEHETEFVEGGISKEDGYYYNVRHILIPIEGGTEEDDGTITYSDADWENCRAEAQKVLDDFLAGDATEDAFAQLAAELSADSGSSSNGGMYTNLTKDYGFIQGFEDWYVDESRQVGDTGLVKNTESSIQGYHVMYFSGKTVIWEYETRTSVLADKTSALLEEADAKWPLEVNYKKILLGQVELTAE